VRWALGRGSILGAAGIGLLLLAAAILLPASCRRLHGPSSSTMPGGHFLSGMMIGDYLLRTGSSANPVAFLVDFHAHYPLINIGIWPPFHYLVEGAWSLVFGTSARRDAAARRGGSWRETAWATYLAAARRVRLCCGGLSRSRLCRVAARPGRRQPDHGRRAGSRFWALVATLSYVRYLESGRACANSALFGLCAAIAPPHQGQLVPPWPCWPPLVVLIGAALRSFCGRSGFWAPVSDRWPCSSAPWYALTYQRSLGGAVTAVSHGQGEAGTPFYFRVGLHIRGLSPTTPRLCSMPSGPLILALAVLGFSCAFCIAAPRSDKLALGARRVCSPRSSSFQLLVPIALQDRYPHSRRAAAAHSRRVRIERVRAAPRAHSRPSAGARERAETGLLLRRRAGAPCPSCREAVHLAPPPRGGDARGGTADMAGPGLPTIPPC